MLEGGANIMAGRHKRMSNRVPEHKIKRMKGWMKEGLKEQMHG